ncbi:MAG: hypothetical protein KatS3mg115_1156 [Candidatus Poribacteria bacterium]|nr:MAG: hypothetical protein KatS3mg115_1156 [Candidatus Poribacteria bacterium]
MQRVRWWRVALIVFLVLVAIAYLLPSLPGFYEPMFGYLPRELQDTRRVEKPIVLEDGLEFELSGIRTAAELNRAFRQLATVLRQRAEAIGLKGVTINGSPSPLEDARHVQSKLTMKWENLEEYPPAQALEAMHLYGKLPLWARGSIFPESRIQLGLDLKGGVYLVLELDMEEAQRQLAEELQRNIRSDLRERYRVNCREVRSEGDSLIVVIKPNPEWGQPGDTRKADTEAYFDGLETVQWEPINNGQPNAEGLVLYRLRLDPSRLEEQQEQAVAQVLEVLRNRVDAFGVAEPDIRREPNRPRIIVQLPGARDSSAAANVVKTMGRLEFRLVKQRGGSPWVGTGEPPTPDQIPSDAEVLFDREGRWLVVERTPVVTGTDLVRATTQRYFADIVVAIKFNANGRRAFGKATAEHVGESLAIVLDNVVVSYPRIDEPILGGEAIIRGNFTEQEAHDLARILRAGAFPVGVKIAEERTVGPSLGREAIRHGAQAAALGMVLVLLFMIFYYRMGGVFATVALLLNGLFILAALAMFGATLTLPGIAGLVLTIGMAVDANVLINERIKEELRSGKSVTSAINAGYGRVFWTIFDANLTTILTALVLIQFGTGPVRGFGVTLSVGIITSMFTALFVTREFFRLYEGRRDKTLPIYPLFGGGRR